MPTSASPRDAPAGAPLLEIENVAAAYGDVQVLWDVSLTVRTGEIVALVGANGAGKTTLLHLLSGLHVGSLERTGGRIWFAGAPLDGLDAAEIVERGLVQVPEGRHLFPGLTVLENLRLGGYSRRARDDGRALARVFELLPLLRERRGQRAGSMSGGEQQLLAIGRALVQRPVLLMLDEPSLGLAPRMVAALFDLIGRIREEGVGVLLVEQNVRQALVLADRAYVIANGRVVLGGKGADLLADQSVKRAYLGI
jgi:branched-chain amino acid transport system ATP-binding protein